MILVEVEGPDLGISRHDRLGQAAEELAPNFVHVGRGPDGTILSGAVGPGDDHAPFRDYDAHAIVQAVGVIGPGRRPRPQSLYVGLVPIHPPVKAIHTGTAQTRKGPAGAMSGVVSYLPRYGAAVVNGCSVAGANESGAASGAWAKPIIGTNAASHAWRFEECVFISPRVH